MPVLANQRHELFAQALAAGKKADRAYVEAGYKPNKGNSTHLRKTEEISQRVTELLQLRNTLSVKAAENAAGKIEISKFWVMSMLKLNLERSMQLAPIMNADGEKVFVYNGAVANKAAELIGRELGMFIDRKEFRVVDEFQGLSDADLVKKLAQTAQLLLVDQSEAEEPEDGEK